VSEPIDIVLLSHNRLDHLIRTVEALHTRTPEPFRLTLVDNASESEVRNWLDANRRLFHRVIPLPENEHLPAFQRGIEATTSDPYVVSDPDLVVPELEPSWLDRLQNLMERHPDFGLIGVGLDPVNRPLVLDPEPHSPLIDGELVETAVGTWFQMIRRDALREPYTKDSQACNAVRAAGYRVGWAPGIRCLHLGWDDHALHPSHLVAKHEAFAYTVYREVDLIAHPPSLEELAAAGPVAALVREAGIPDEAVLELAWGPPILGPVLERVVTLHPAPTRLSIEDRAVGAVVLVEPRTPDALDEAFRVASRLVVALVTPRAFGEVTAGDLAARGWSGSERPAARELVVELARAGDTLPRMRGHERFDTLERRERWLELFAAGAFGPTAQRLFVFLADEPGPVQAVSEGLERWIPPPRVEQPRSRLRSAVARRTPATVRRLVRRVLP
jgi:glycosyl transferase family 2